MHYTIRTFTAKLILFSLPLLLLTAIPIGLTYYTGEIMPPSVVTSMRAAHPDFIYGPRFGRDMLTYNLLVISQQRPNILVTGSSRAWLFRSEFFSKPSASFYNASDAGWTLQQVDALLRRIDPAAYPDVLLLGIDKPWFNPAFVPLTPATATEDQDILGITRALMGFIALNPPELPILLGRRDRVYGSFALGVSAIATGVGIRSDGSLRHGEVMSGRAPIQAMREEHLGSLANSTNMFVAGAEVSASTLTQLDTLLRFTHEHGIHVIAFAPPFKPDIYQIMRSGGNHTYLWTLDPLLQDMFAQYGYAYFDFTDPASVHAVDTDFSDGWHASERTSAQMLAQMVRGEPEILEQYTDAAYIEDAIDRAPNPFQVFD